jgi:hypothetical protein
MKASMIVAALLSTVSALPAANTTEATEVAEVSPAEIQDLAAKTIASIKLVKDGGAKPEEVAVQIKENVNQFENFVSSLNRGGNTGAMMPAFNDFANGVKAGFGGPGGFGGGKGGFGGYGYKKCYTRADDVEDGDNDLDGDCDDDDSVAGLLGLLLEVVGETLDQLIPGLDDVVEELTDELGTNDKNTHKSQIKEKEIPDVKHGKGHNGGHKSS